MAITERQLAARNEHIGSSDVAAILGLSPYKSAYDLWLEKTEQIESAITETREMEAGRLFEPGLLAFAEESLGKITRRNTYRSRPEIHLGCNIDAMLSATGEPVEAKTSGLFGPLRGEWGEDGTDQIPEMHIVQCHAHMMVLNDNIQRCHVPAFLGGRGFMLYMVMRNDALCDLIADKCQRFWCDNVMRVIPPIPGTISEQYAKIRKREVGKIVQVNPELITQLLAAQDARKRAKEIEDEMRGRLMAEMNDAEVADGGEVGAFTFLSQTSTRFDGKQFQSDHPDVYEQYTRSSTYRVLRFKKPKAI